VAHILHISCDFPDVLVPSKTQAIKRLIDGTPEHRHIVYSLNRVDGFSGIEIVGFGKDRFAVAYRAPPKGIFLKTFLGHVAESILVDFKRNGLKADIVHAHKLTIDGIVANKIAKRLDLPILFSVQGDTDTKVASARPDLALEFRKHVEVAELLFPFAPWAHEWIALRFPAAVGKSVLLPVMPEDDSLSSCPIIGAPRLATVFHLESWRRKNLPMLAKAIELLSRNLPNIRLDIYGGGSPRSLLEVKEVVAAAGAGKVVEFKGPVPNSDVAKVLKNYAAFVLPTLRESYGLVHAEALFSGLPILISRNMGIDKILPECEFIKPCDPRSESSVADSIRELIQRELVAKSELAGAQSNGVLEPLRRSSIINTYRHGLTLALERKRSNSLDPVVTTR
jgi:glycosyltransferase involved in cell wall biosynthesis